MFFKEVKRFANYFRILKRYFKTQLYINFHLLLQMFAEASVKHAEAALMQVENERERNRLEQERLLLEEKRIKNEENLINYLHNVHEVINKVLTE